MHHLTRWTLLWEYIYPWKWRSLNMFAKCLSILDNRSSQWLPCLVILSVLSFCGTCINSFVLFIFLKMKSVFNNANKFLITLTVGQIILTLFVGPFRITQIVSTTDTSNCYMDSVKDYVDSLILISAVSNGLTLHMDNRLKLFLISKLPPRYEMNFDR